ncbi:MAG: hypothetical protein WCI51_02320 [Lentisphaerota bacterium]
MIKRVQPGVIRIPATDYNQIGEATEAVQAMQKSFNAGIYNAFDNGGIIIDICNDGDESIPIYSPIELISPLPLLLTNGNAAQYNGIRPAFKGKAASATTKDVFVIAQDKIEPKAIKPALAQGMTVAKVTISSTAHQFAIPDVANPGKLKSASSGICRMLWKAGNSGEVWTVLMLGGGGSGATEYNGYFTAISSGTGKIKVVNGARPTDTVAGYVKLGNTRLAVAVAEFTVSSAGLIWIYTKNTSGTLTAELRNGGTLPTEVRGEDIRAIITYDSAAAITQIWQLGEYVITGKAG